jgi:predicted DNA-binding transcriptional regulator AlpA
LAHDDLQLLTTAEVASLLRLAKRTLEEMRIAGTGPNYIKSTLGSRGVVRYRPSDIIKWMERQSVRTEQDNIPSKVVDDKPPISDLLSEAEGLMTARETELANNLRNIDPHALGSRGSEVHQNRKRTAF